MKPSMVALAVVLASVVIVSGQRGAGPSPEQQAALAKQEALEKATPRLQITEEDAEPRRARPHDWRSGRRGEELQGPSVRVHAERRVGAGARRDASQLFEFDPNLKFVKQWGPDNYAASFAHTVRVDKSDNVWMTDEGVEHDRQVQSRRARSPWCSDASPKPSTTSNASSKQGETRGGHAARRRRRHLQPPDRRRLGRSGQHLRRGRLQQLARREDVQGRQVGEGARHARCGARTSSTPSTASRPTPRATSTWPTAATAAFRCSTRI